MRRDLILIGGSAGGLDALLLTLRDLPPDFRAAILVALHIPADGSENLPKVVQHQCALPVVFASDGDPIVQGQVAIAPPDYHLVVSDGVLRTLRSAREHRHRPAIDPLFRSGAESHGARVIALVLSGAGSDGTAGMVAIRKQGGYLLVQDPEDARFPVMPQSVLDTVAVDAYLPASQIARHLQHLINESVSSPEGTPVPPSNTPERPASFLETSIERT
ncbi:MAG: chemotaxis protein CheB, partial [Thermomicrobiales bacterium]